jgi:hypothetical protein
MSKKMICIAFRHGGIIPAAVLGAEKNKFLNAHEPFEVPATYGQSLIDDRFAYEAKPEKKKGKEKPVDATDAKAAAIDAAQQKVDAARAALGAADMVDKPAAEAVLAHAEAELAGVKG